MGSRDRGTLGRRAERQAYRFLLDQGLRPVARNFHTRGGEIDLVMLDGRCLTFIEVRFRSSNRFSTPLLTVDRHKQKKLVRTAMMFIAQQRFYARHIMRFDVVGIGEDGIEWLKDAFRPDEIRG